jgi:hypothetical protein
MLLRTLSMALTAALLTCGCGESTEATGIAGSGGAGGTQPVEPGPTCIAFCVKVVGGCRAFAITEQECREFCQLSLDAEYAHAEPCGEAAEDVFLCATELDCEGVKDWRDQIPSDAYPCREKVLVYDALVADGVCPQGT